MIGVEHSRSVSIDSWASIRNLRVLCIGNGGMVYRNGGLWSHRCTGDFLEGMARLAGQICFCAWLDPNDDPLAQTGLQNIPGVRAVALPRFVGRPLRKLINGIRAFAMLSREVSRADFVYLYWPGWISSVTARLCRALRKPYGIYFRGEQIDPDPSFADAFRRARFVIAAGDLLRNIAQVYCENVENVTPMTSLRSEHVRPPRDRAKSSLWRLLYVGRLEERKGVADLLAAAVYLEEWGVPFTLTLVGHCYDAPGLLRGFPESVTRHLNIVDAVAGFENLIPYYCAADAFVFPSHDEGFPRVLYEAMAFGLPIVTTFVGSIPSVMEDRKNCVRIDVKNPRDIAEKIRLLLSDPELQKRIAWASHQRITELTKSWERSHPLQVAENLRDLC
jgi:glycosyltransferase involved in cell wall biosynthesis